MTKTKSHLVNFFNKPEIKHYVEEENLDVVYERYTALYNDGYSLTSYLESCGVDPLEYVTRIHDSMYADRKDLMSFIVPTNFVSIDKSAFMECTNLQEVRIPRSIKLIGYDAFLECINLRNAQYEGTMLEWRKIRKTAAFDNTDITFVHCSDGIIYPEEL